MIWVGFIYMYAIALYNLSDRWCNTQLPDEFYNLPPCYLRWAAFFAFFTFLPISAAYYRLSRLEYPFAKKVVYKVVSAFSAAYCIYEIFIYTSKDVAIYLGRINSKIWESVFILIVLLMFCYITLSLIKRQNDYR